MNSADQVSIVLIYSCQFNSHSFMQKHLLNERFTLVIDGLIGVPRRVQVHEIQLYLRLQAHDVRSDQSSAKDVLQN